MKHSTSHLHFVSILVPVLVPKSSQNRTKIDQNSIQKVIKKLMLKTTPTKTTLDAILVPTWLQKGAGSGRSRAIATGMRRYLFEVCPPRPVKTSRVPPDPPILRHLGAILDPFWTILGRSWGDLGSILKPFWGHVGVILEPCWG